jgi:antitoxin VapB
MIAGDPHHLQSYAREHIEHIMKRIIGGVTYNTATATVLARSERHDPQENVERELTLYQTLGGAFFLYRATHHRTIETVEDSMIEPLTPEQARRWLSETQAEVFHNPFGALPKATGAAEPAATVYLRVPAALKDRMEAAARAQSQSLNAWAIRTFEWRLSNAVFETIMRSDARAHALADRSQAPDDETEQRVQELSKLTGEKPMETIAVAVRERLERVRDRCKGSLADRLVAIGRVCAARLGADYRALDHDALLYDNKGLPR